MKRAARTLVLALAVASCSSPSQTPTFAPGIPAAFTPSSGEQLRADAEIACAETGYSRCVESVMAAQGFGSGSLIAICDYGDRTGDVVLIDSEADAEDECSGGGAISPSRVVDVLTIP